MTIWGRPHSFPANHLALSLFLFNFAKELRQVLKRTGKKN